MVVIQAPPMVEERRGADRVGVWTLGAAGELGADAGAQLGGGLVGEGEGEDGVGGDALVDDEAGVALDHDAGLAGAGAGLEQDVAAASLDRGALLRGGGALDRGRGRRTRLGPRRADGDVALRALARRRGAHRPHSASLSSRST
ncbi:MAG: hypothetical protein QM760_16710 [Nibricoccus sp.]